MEKLDEISFNDMIANASDLNSIIVTFYFNRRETALDQPFKGPVINLVQDIISYFDRNDIILQQNNLGGWTCDHYKSFRHFFVNAFPAFNATADASGLQVGVSTEQPAKEGWKEMRKFLQEIITPWKKSVEVAIKGKADIMIGYTLAYKGVVPTDIKFKTPHLGSEVLEQAQPLFHETQGSTFCSQQMPMGLVFLTAMPSAPFFGSNITYVALEPAGKNGQAIEKLFFHHAGIACHLDLYVHKSSYQYLQLTGGFHKEYSNRLKSISDGMSRMLSDVKMRHSSGVDKVLLEENATRLAEVMIPYIDYILLEKSVAIQGKNYQATLSHYLSLNAQVENTIFTFQQKFIESQASAAELIGAKISSIIDFAKTSLSFADTLEAKVTNERSNKLQLLITMIGIGLAFIQIFDNDSAKGLLHSLGCIQKGQAPAWYIMLTTKIIITGLLILLFCIPIIFRKASKRKEMTE